MVGKKSLLNKVFRIFLNFCFHLDMQGRLERKSQIKLEVERVEMCCPYMIVLLTFLVNCQPFISRIIVKLVKNRNNTSQLEMKIEQMSGKRR